MTTKRDVFLCHASEEKNDVIRPIATALKKDGVTYWLDEAEIKWGDSIIQKVNEGLCISKYVIVVLSESFLSKNYPQRELNSALHIEASTGEVRVLPLLVGTEAIKKRIRETFPILGDKKYESWESDTQQIVESLHSRLSDKTISPESVKNVKQSTFEIPMPKIKKKFTQRDKDIFTKKSFNEIKVYFGKALEQLDQTYSEVDTDLTEIHNFKFVATIYLDGEVKNKCKIWIGGMNSNSISYHEGDMNFDQDNTYTNWLTVTDEGYELGFDIGNRFSSGFDQNNEGILNSQQAAEYLWKQLTARLDM